MSAPVHTTSANSVLGRRTGESGSEALERTADSVLGPVIGKPDKTRATKLPRQVAAIIYMRLGGMSNAEIAEKMGVKVRRISQIMFEARTRYNFSDILERVQHQAIPQAIENLNQFLEDGDREMTLETLKGTGVFRKHVVGKESGGSGAGNTLKVEISLPEGVTFENMPVVAVGSILANPRRPALSEPKVETIDAVS